MHWRPHIVATSSMSERIGPGVGAVVRLRRGDERAVVRLDRLVGDDAGKDQLAAAARAPVVRLRVADRDLQVALGDGRQQPDGRAARRDADVRVRLGVPRLVLVERDAEPLEPGQVVAADLLLDVRLGHREDLAVRAREHRRLARPPRPRRARRAAASTRASAGTGCRSRSRPSSRTRAAPRSAAPRPAPRALRARPRSRRRPARARRGRSPRAGSRPGRRARATRGRPCSRRPRLRSSAGRATRTGS